MRLFIPLIVSGLTAFAFAESCDPQEQIAQSQSYAQRGLTFRAIDVLETALEQCYHPRIKLELGALYLQLGDVESANGWWQSALDNDHLPDKVATSVKLRVLQTQLSPPQAGQAHLLFSLGARYQQTLGVDNNASLLGIGRLNAAPINTFGYATTPALYAKVSVSQRYYWQDDAAFTALVLEPGLRADSKPVSLLASPLFMANNSRVGTGARGKLALRTQHSEWTSELNWTTINQQLSFTQAARFSAQEWQGELQAKAYHEQQWQWQSIESKLRLTQRWRPTVQVQYELPTSTTSSYVQATWPLTNTLRLQTQLGVAVNDVTRWHGKTVLNWQPF